MFKIDPAAGGRCRVWTSLGGDSHALTRLTPEEMTDGPWCPDADSANRFDADLLRIRTIAVTLRVESALEALRGPAGALFMRAGTAADATKFLNRRGPGRPGGQDGAALIIAMMCTRLLMALGAALILTTTAETTIAANYRDSDAAFFAADAVLGRATGDLAAISDWNLLQGGFVRSAFIDGAPSGPRTLLGGSTIDLTQITNNLNCQRATACSAADMHAVTADSPWGGNNPRWQLFAYGPLVDMLPAGAITSPYYVVAFVADDASETDGDPTRDGVDPVVNPSSRPDRGARRSVRAPCIASGD